MRILVLIPDAFGGRGGIAKYNQDFLTGLCAHPYTTEVVAVPRNVVDPLKSLPDKLTYITSGMNGKINYIFAVLKAITHNYKFDLVICGHINLLPLTYLIHLWVKAPIFMMLYGIEAWQKYPSNRLANSLINKIDGIISISEITKNRFLNWTKLENIKEFVLLNAVNLDHFTPDAKNSSLIKRYKLEGKTVLMTLGRLNSRERYKGFDEILNVLPNLIQQFPNLSYMIVGKGDDRKRLETKTKSLGIEKHVVFTGFITESEKVDHYRLADAFVMPGRGEGFGFVYLEAMACGIPVVASKVDGSREAVRNGLLGILVNPNDPEEIKIGILEALKRPKGVVPDGLDYFSNENFERRCHEIIDKIFKSIITNS